MANGRPKEGTPAWDASLRDNPQFVKETIRSVTERAAANEPGAAELLARWLAEYPEHKAAVAALDDLTAKAETAWVKAAGSGDRLAEQAARADAAALKAELLPPDAGVLDRVLAGAVVVAHLAHAHAAQVAAAGACAPATQAARDRRLLDTQKLLLNAVKAWQLIAGKKAAGLRPRLRVFEARPAVS